MEIPEYNIMIVGVGGMGVITAANILKEYGMLSKKIIRVRVSESRGVSQREGSVYAYIKYITEFDRNKYITDGVLDILRDYIENIPPQPIPSSVDLMIALEPLEFVRNLRYLKEKSVVLLNSHPNVPKSLVAEQSRRKADISQSIPDNIMGYDRIFKFINGLKESAKDIRLIEKNYTKMAMDVYGKSVMANVLMLKELPGILPELFSQKVLESIMQLS